MIAELVCLLRPINFESKNESILQELATLKGSYVLVLIEINETITVLGRKCKTKKHSLYFKTKTFAMQLISCFKGVDN